jgi:hypothetical protein
LEPICTETIQNHLRKMPTTKCTAALPCFQFYVANGKLSCQLYQRSADIFLESRSISRPMHYLLWWLRKFAI